MTRGKLTTMFGMAGVVLTLGVASAFACTNLATLGTSTAAGKPGTNVTVNGLQFAAPAEGAAALPVVVHWNKADGPVLAELTPDARGNVTGAITVPEADAGHYVVVATQVDAEGEAQFGTPARAAFEVLGADGQSAPVPAPSAATASSDSDSAVSTALVLVLGVVAIGLFSAGFVSFMQERRRQRAPEAQPVRRS